MSRPRLERGLLAEKGTELGGPWSHHLEGPVRELRIRLRDNAARITYWCTAEGTIVLLTVFRKTRQHDLAERAGTTADEIECIEEGGTEPTIALLRRLAAALDSDVHLTAGHDLDSVRFESHAA